MRQRECNETTNAKTPRSIAAYFGVLTLAAGLACSPADEPEPAPASGGTAQGGSGGTSGSGGNGGTSGHGSHDHCVEGFDADWRDQNLTGKPDEWKSPSGAIDLVLPKEVLAWMGERVWEKSHDAWHNVRRCNGGGVPGLPGGGDTSICEHEELIAEHQECADAEDGYQFLVMHRHMMRALRQAFPRHTGLFDGFPSFPFDLEDVPAQWQDRFANGWSQQIKSVATTLESIENEASRFPTEGDLGKFIQCGGASNGVSSIHGAMHFKWVVNESPYSLGKQTVNIDNYMFWKLHGWIDTIWERYRLAKGIAPDAAELKQALLDQCHEMHTLGAAVDPNSIVTNPDTVIPVEHGFFHEKVRPILEKNCIGCHSDNSPDAGMRLGGRISSANVVKQLVDVQSVHGGQFKRVVPGNPNQSWLYLKVSGAAVNADCVGTSCNAQVMPRPARSPSKVASSRQSASG